MRHIWKLEPPLIALKFSDLSYNKITGSLSHGDFLNQPNLIDLYLGFNRIQSIDEGAFVGLKKLQVLEISSNNLKQIHSNAFIPIQNSIYELNLSHNNRLTSIPSLGLEQLISFKSFGNEQLRQLPIFKSAKSLALTYAYHCCDYLPTTIASSRVEGVHSGRGQQEAGDDLFLKTTYSDSSLVTQLINSILAKLGRLFTTDDNGDGLKNESSSSASHLREGEELFGKPKRRKSLETFEESIAHSDNFTELVIWPQVGLDLNHESEEPKNGGRRRKKRNQNIKNHHRLRRHFNHIYNHNHNHHHHHHNHHRTLERSSTTRLPEFDQDGSERVSSMSGPNYLIDDSLDSILLEVKQIRIAHKIWMPSGINGKIGQEINALFSGDISTRKKRHLESTSTMAASLLFEDPSPTSTLIENLNFSRETSNSGNVKCLPKPSAFFPCQDLFDTWWLRVGIWSVFLLAFTGNILVIVVLSLVKPSSATSALTSIMWLAHSKRHIDVPRFLVINLAVADLFMAIYLGLLAFVDLSTLGEFKLFAIKWQYSTGCKLAGFLGVLSSELSVFILAIITLERNYAITNAVHLNRRLSLQKAMFIMFIGYTFALTMAIMPLNGISDYKKFSICLPLDIDSNLSSQIYIITLIAINTFSFLLLLSCYLRMYCAIRGSQAWNTNDLRIAKRMSILVVTDFLCWMPIIIVAIATLFGYHVIGTNGIKILTIFILPLNSVANPFLYAITTKKFKRDLDTLIRRTRSSVNFMHFCHKGDDRLEDPKIFIGNYNEYQYNLMLNQKNQNKKNLLANEFNRHQYSKQKQKQHQQQQQQMMMIDRKNNQKKYLKQDRFNHKMTTRPFAHNTANQVTINKTSCSCQRHLQDEPNIQQQQQQNYRPGNTISGSSSSSSGSVIVQVNAHMKPKIVLDSVEADSFVNEEINDSVGNLRNNSSNNCTNSSLKLESENHLILNRDSNNNNNSKLLSTNSTFKEQNLDRFYDSSCLRHKSDRICDRRQTSNRPIGSSCHAIIACKSESQSLTRGGGATNEFNKQNRINTRYLNVSDNIQQDQARSASACGYSTISKKNTMDNHSHITTTKVTSTGGDVQYHSCASIKDTRVSGSYDTIQVKKGKEIRSKRSNEKLSQSINRLLFNPIAKAWSSIQISFSSSASHVAAIATGKQSSSRLDEVDQEEPSATGATTTTTTPKKESTNNSTTIEEMLLLSSPSSRPFASERRMSRSCDLVPQQNPTCLMSSSSSIAGGSSQSNYDDDQRILLATINRIAANRGSAKRLRVSGNQHYANIDYINNEENLYRHECLKDTVVNNIHSDRQCDTSHPRPRGTNHQRRLSRSSKQRFNRCRSWSPALLNKLEDCIHQIKHKIPGFNSNSATKDELDEHNLNYQEVHESSTHDSSHIYSGCCSNDIDDPLIEQNNSNEEQRFCESGCHDFDRRGDESDLNEAEDDDYDNDISEIDPTNNGDVFDERAIDEWSLRRKNVFKRRHAGRLSKFQHQSSTNSDTLSTRTGVTMVTNMSLSFDDVIATGSANCNQFNSTIQRLHSVDEASENQVTVERDNNNK